MTCQFDPPWTALDSLDHTLNERGYALLSPDSVASWCGQDLEHLKSLQPFWDRLPPDPHLRDGGRYRHRRHGCFISQNESLERAPHRAHWQPLAYNALHGGMERWFEPLEPELVDNPTWSAVLLALARQASALHGLQPWFIEAHPFRIDTKDGIGRPTPEGAHRDGVDLVAVFLLQRQAIKGGETRVFEASGPTGLRFTLSEPWSLMLLDDHRVIHESTPIQPLETDQTGWRDTLVVTCRRGGFQGDKRSSNA
ncbi:MAG: 2OG-Fe dioxygenase family protein [Pseudomonadota bacterium]